MEDTLNDGVGKSLNPFDDDIDDEPQELAPAGGENEMSTTPIPVQQLEQCWSEMDSLLRSNTMDPFAMEELREQTSNIEKLLIKDQPSSRGQIGPCLRYLLSENVIENLYMFTTRQKLYAKDIRIMLLKFFTEVFTRANQPVLIHQQILRPISKLLRACEGTNDKEMNASLIPLLHTMCILMQENQSLLDLFFIESQVHMQSRFLIFTQLIPHMHESSDVGNRARDALLLCLSLADQLPASNLTHFIASDSNFCQVLATGLSALYSELPSTRDLVVDEWQSPLPVIEKAVPELHTFIQALNFCNSVLQMAPKLVCNTMLTLVREGFLQQVMGAALLQSSQSAVMFATAYVTLFLTHITNVALMREFLRYLMQGHYDGRSVLNAVLQNISSSNHLLCAVTLELFYVLLDFNCEDVLLELVLKYLLSGCHVMPNQLAIVGSPDLYAQAARKFLQLMPAVCIAAEKMFLDSIRKSMTPPPPPPPPPPPQLSEGVDSLGTPPPMIASTLPHSTNHLERPIPVRPSSTTKLPLTNLPVFPPPSATSSPSTNPFDDPLPVHPPLSRSRSDSDASTCSLVSMSSVSSTPQTAGGVPFPMNGAEIPRAKPSGSVVPVSSSSTTTSFRFNYISPEMAYFSSLATAREGIKECACRCHCWSSIYDKCIVSKETLMKENRKIIKSLEMEDLAPVQIRITDEETTSAGVGEDEMRSFRQRATTVSTRSSRTFSRSSRTSSNHSQLHSDRVVMTPEEDEETKVVAGVHSTEHAQKNADRLSNFGTSPGLQRSGTISGGTRPQRVLGSPRHNRKSSSTTAQFDDRVGLFLKVVMDKLMDMMQHPPTVNILLTRLISRLAYYPQPLLRSLLLNHQLVLKPGIPNLFTVLQFLKQGVDRYARTQDGFEKRLGRARKTMVYRAKVRNSQMQASIARQIVLYQLQRQTSRAELDSSVTIPSSLDHHSSLVKRTSMGNMSVSSHTKAEPSSRMTQDQGEKLQHRSSKKRSKKVPTDTLFAVVIFHEFLQELASISEEQSVMHSLLYLPKSTPLLV